MRSLALLIALLIIIAALRVAFGLVLVLVAPSSRAPKTLRALGAVVLVAGLATPLFGVERTRGIVDWAAAQNAALIRGAAAVVLTVGSFIAFAVATRRPARA